MPGQWVILSVKIDTEERFLERILFEGRTKVIDDLLRLIQPDFFAKRYQRIDDFGYAACGITKLMRTSGLRRIEDTLSSEVGRGRAA